MAGSLSSTRSKRPTETTVPREPRSLHITSGLRGRVSRNDERSGMIQSDVQTRGSGLEQEQRGHVVK
jgi:hypothetical protein